MSFSSIPFLFLFLPLNILLFYLRRGRAWRNSVLLLGSVIFFAWSDIVHLPVLFMSLLVNYSLGLGIDRSKNIGSNKSSRFIMWGAVIANLTLLIFYKYFGFAGKLFLGFNNQLTIVNDSVLPLGISYFTFSGISYILDIYRGSEHAEKNFIKFATYLVMFPKLIQGPITRYKEVRNQLENPGASIADFAGGIRRFMIGLAKKVLLADILVNASNQVFNADLNSIGSDVAWFGLIAFTMVVYFDFSGYTDMAIGLGMLFGLKLPENFNYPYISRSITDFWRRWHMSLTSWFRTYLFIPLEFTRRRQKFLRLQINILIVFLLTGLWHGSSVNYLIWGLYFGLILAIETSWFGKVLAQAPRFLQHFYALLLIMVGWVFFRLPELANWKPFFSALLGFNGWSGLETFRTLNIVSYYPILIIGVILCLPISEYLEKCSVFKSPVTRIITDFVLIGIFLLVIGYILANGFQPFMYAQF